MFEQNSGARDSFATGDQVDLHWPPEHTFLLDADQDAHAGDETYAAAGRGRRRWRRRVMSVAQAGAAAGGTIGLGPARLARAAQAVAAGYLLLLPGHAVAGWSSSWSPPSSWSRTSLYDPNGSLETGYAMTWSFGNYLDALQEYHATVPALAATTPASATVPGAAAGLPAGLRDRVQVRAAGRTSCWCW